MLVDKLELSVFAAVLNGTHAVSGFAGIQTLVPGARFNASTNPE
jgi:hypothetical protein